MKISISAESTLPQTQMRMETPSKSISRRLSSIFTRSAEESRPRPPPGPSAASAEDDRYAAIAGLDEEVGYSTIIIFSDIFKRATGRTKKSIPAVSSVIRSSKAHFFISPYVFPMHNVCLIVRMFHCFGDHRHFWQADKIIQVNQGILIKN